MPNEREAILGQLIRSYKSLEQMAKRMGDREKEKHCRESAELYTCQLLGYPQPVSYLQERKVEEMMPKSKLTWMSEKECDMGCRGKCSGCH
jgi:hypothetical protein